MDEDGTGEGALPLRIDGGSVPRLSPGWSLARGAGRLAASGLPLLPVTDGEGRLLGTLSMREVEGFLLDAAAGEGLPEEEALLRAAVSEAMDPPRRSQIPQFPKFTF